MQTATFARIGLLAGLLLNFSAQAQNFRPFRAGFTYQLSESATPGDTTHVLQVSPAGLAGADSVFRFTRRTSQSVRVQPAHPCGRFVDRADNLFGTTLTVSPGRNYRLTAINGRSLLLRAGSPIGQAWPAAPGLTAQVLARTTGTILGQPDSLLTIGFSDGASLVLSKAYGWVSGPALGHYLNPHLPLRQLTLTALPEARLGAAVTGSMVVFDFQPGDVFLRRTDGYGMTYPCPAQTWTRDSVVSRSDSPGRDTIRYQIRRRTLQRSCSSNILGAYVMQTFVVTRSSVSALTSFWGGNSANSGSQIHLPAWRTASFNGRPLQQHFNGMTCGAPATQPDTLSLMDAGALDSGGYVWTAPGLGATRAFYPNFSTEDTYLMGYRKGSETWGQLTTFAQLLPAAAAKPAATTAAFPNPFSQELTIKFEFSRPQAVALELRDALGRVVLTQPATPRAAGTGTLQLNTTTLPAGVYTAFLQPAAGPAQVLKVVKQ
jgi:hypothetical protein